MPLFTGPLKWTTPDSSVEIDASYAAMFDRLADQLGPAAAAELTRKIEEIYQHARGSWPVGPQTEEYTSGRRRIHSRDQLQRSVSISPDGAEVTAQIVNDAPWAGDIEWARRSGKSGHVADTLLMDPGEEAAPEMAAELGRVISGLVKG